MGANNQWHYQFGLVSMVALMPLITIQVLGIMFKVKKSKEIAKAVTLQATANVSEDEIIIFNRKKWGDKT